MKASLQHLEAGLRETRAELRADVRDLGNKIDRKFDRLLYLVISGLVGLVLKGGLDYFVSGKEVTGSAQQGREKLSEVPCVVCFV
jgi:hypothetical protein